MAVGANSSLVLIAEIQLDIRHCCSILRIKMKFVKSTHNPSQAGSAYDSQYEVINCSSILMFSCQCLSIISSGYFNNSYRAIQKYQNSTYIRVWAFLYLISIYLSFLTEYC